VRASGRPRACGHPPKRKRDGAVSVLSLSVIDARRSLAKTLNLSLWLTGCRKSGLPDFQRRERTGAGTPAGPEKWQCASQNREKTWFIRQAGRPERRSGQPLSFCPVTGCLRPVGFDGQLALKVQLARQNQEKTWFCCRSGILSLRAVGSAVAVVETKPGKDLVSSWTAAGTGRHHTPPATAKHRTGLVGLITKNPESVRVGAQAKSTKPDNVRVGAQAISRNKPLITVPFQIVNP